MADGVKHWDVGDPGVLTTDTTGTGGSTLIWADGLLVRTRCDRVVRLKAADSEMLLSTSLARLVSDDDDDEAPVEELCKVLLRFDLASLSGSGFFEYFSFHASPMPSKILLGHIGSCSYQIVNPRR